MPTLSFNEIKELLVQILRDRNFSLDRAELIAQTHTQSSCDGVYSHGLNRFPLFIDYVDKGLIDVTATPQCISSFGTLEQWDGNLGSGVINAHRCMDRAITLAEEFTLGCVALRNTNHWMRGGSYGWRAAKKGKIALCFTNTKPNMPPWGGRENRIGNNPFIVAIPRKEGHVVLDMSMSQYAFGKINTYRLNGEELPFAGGWDEDGNLSTSPVDILASGQGLPIGYWKGSAMSMVLDMLAALLSGGNSTREVGEHEYEIGISQVFICIDPSSFSDQKIKEKLLNEIIDFVHESPPRNAGTQTYYPGEKTLITRKDHRQNGVPVNEEVWDKIVTLAK